MKHWVGVPDFSLGVHLGKSAKDVAKILDEKLYGIAEKYDVEIGAIIRQIGENSFTFLDPATQFSSSGVIIGDSNLADGDVGRWHTHQDGSDFSQADIRNANGFNADAYLSNDSGIMKYDRRQFYSDTEDLIVELKNEGLNLFQRDARVQEFNKRVVGTYGGEYSSYIYRRAD